MQLFQQDKCFNWLHLVSCFTLNAHLEKVATKMQTQQITAWVTKDHM